MSDRLKRILIGIAFILAVGGIAAALYFVFFRPIPPSVVVNEPPTFPGELPPTQPGVPPTVPVEPTPPGLPTAPGIVVPPTVAPPTGPTISSRAEGGITVAQSLVSANASFTEISPNGSSVNFYDTSTGLFNRVNPDGSIDLLSTRSFREVESVSWSPNDNQAVLEFPDGSNIVYNFDTDQSVTLPNQYEGFSFSPDGSQIAAKDIKLNPEDRWLVVVDNQGRNRRLAYHLGENQDRVQVKWSPNDQIIATSAKSIDGDRSEVTFLTKNQEQISKAMVQGRDLRYDYSPSGNRIVYSVYNSQSNYLPTLWVTNTNPGSVDTVRINTGLNTWADKCTFSSDTTIFCAVPQNVGEFSGILRSNNTSDDLIYKIDTRSGQATLAAEPLIPTKIQSMRVSADGRNLYYVDESDGSINMINL